MIFIFKVFFTAFAFALAGALTRILFEEYKKKKK